MQAVGVGNFDAYEDYLEVHQEEFQNLFNTILINVTSFFRDTEAWDYIRETVLPQSCPGRKPLPRCASG